jgi:hypothetical protein
MLVPSIFVTVLPSAANSRTVVCSLVMFVTGPGPVRLPIAPLKMRSSLGHSFMYAHQLSPTRP